MSIKELRKIFKDDTDELTGTISQDTGQAFRVATRKGTITVPRASGYKVGDRVHIRKGSIIQKLNNTTTKVFEV